MDTITALEIAYSLSVFGIEAEIDTTAPAATAPTPAAPAKPIRQMTVRELRDLARGKVKGFMQMKKAELIAALEVATAPTPAPVRKRRRKARADKAA